MVNLHRYHCLLLDDIKNCSMSARDPKQVDCHADTQHFNWMDDRIQGVCRERNAVNWQ